MLKMMNNDILKQINSRAFVCEIGTYYSFKESSSIFFPTFFFSNFWRFWYYKKPHIFS